jgi:hypothetical protein
MLEHPLLARLDLLLRMRNADRPNWVNVTDGPSPRDGGQYSSEEAAQDLVVWLLILLGVVSGLGILAAVEILALISGS